jgi:DNA replication protein DnaC
MGYFRADVPPGQPGFGKPIPCDNPFHTAERINRMAQASNLHAGDLARRLDDIAEDDRGRNSDMLQAARQMAKHTYGWLYIWGGPGNAKSEILIALVNEINESGKGPAMYCTFSHLVNWVREAFRDNADSSYIQRFDRLKALKLLAVDEMDKARDTEFSTEFRFQFLDERYRQAILGETAMVFASNTDPKLLPEPLWDRVRDGRFRIVHNTAPSARPNMRR